MEWWDNLVATLSSGAFWSGILTGFVLCLVLAVVVMTYVPPLGPSRAALREQERQRVYRGWCATHGWCPHHDVPDGQCPPVEATVNGWTRGLGLCEGSGSVRVTDEWRART